MNFLTPSNKTITSIPKQKTSSAINCTGTPEVKICLDKLSLTLSGFTDQEKIAMLDVALHAKDDGWGQQVYPRNGYKLNLLMNLSSSIERPLFSWNPTNKNRPFFRLEFNPSKLGAEGTEELLGVEIDLLVEGGVPEFLANAKVSRVDAALDLVGIEIRDLLAFSGLPVRSAKYERHGKLETIYLGSSKSGAQTRIYDKAAEMAQNGLTVDSTAPVTRVERIVKNAGWLKNLAQKKNPFATVHLAHFSHKPEGVEEYMWNLLCCHAFQHTTPATLAMLPKPLRTEFKKALKAAEPAWWDTHEIWKQWPALIDHLGLSHGLSPSGKTA